MTFDTVGFFYGYAGSMQPGKAPTMGDAYAFPGSVSDAFKAIPDINEQSVLPQNGDYSDKILTIGPTYAPDPTWTDALYQQVQDNISAIASAGWTGICLDWEAVGSSATIGGLNALLEAITSADLKATITTTATGPYEWLAADKDATALNWDVVASLQPQLYGSSGEAYPASELDEYVNYWLNGAGTSPVSGVIFAAPPPEKLVWACVPETIAYLDSNAPTTGGYTIWGYDPNNE